LPDESRPKLFRRASFALERLNEAVVAAVFVFITIGMFLFLLDCDIYRHPCRWFDGVDVSTHVMVDVLAESDEIDLWCISLMSQLLR
jgi:hypothetical protein